jgi:hypothetical protein
MPDEVVVVLLSEIEAATMNYTSLNEARNVLASARCAVMTSTTYKVDPRRKKRTPSEAVGSESRLASLILPSDPTNLYPERPSSANAVTPGVWESVSR